MARRKQGTAWALATGLATAALSNVALAQTEHVQHFSVRAQPLADALSTLAQEGQRDIIFNADLTRGKSASSLAGNYTFGQAVALLLQGSGLVAKVTAAGSIVIAKSNPTPTAGAGLAEDTTTVVVTGTLIRGVAPTGTNVVHISAQSIRSMGATNSDSVLGHTPEISSLFNTLPALSPINPGLKINQPNIRDLGTASGSTTLVLIDGHRMINTGDLTSPDPDVIPPFALDHIEVMPDGGSSTYGADAVGGVINLITRKHFDGTETSDHVGFAKRYNQEDINLLAGKTLDRTSIYLGANLSANTMLKGKNLWYAKQVSPNLGYCAPGTVQVTVNGTTKDYGLPTLYPNTLSTCDATKNTSWIPRKMRGTLYLGLDHDFNETVHFELRGFLSRLENQFTNDLNSNGEGQMVTITRQNPFYKVIGDNDPGVQTVLLSYEGLLPNETTSIIDSAQITPTLSVSIGQGWQVTALGSYGRTSIRFNTPQIDPTAQAAAATSTNPATALDPYDLSLTAPDVLQGLSVVEKTNGYQDFTDGRLIADGPLLQLPGGALQAAIGIENTRDVHFETIDGCCFSGTANATRTINSTFGELSIPILGGGSSRVGIHTLTIDLAARDDRYSDFGETFNPKYGFTYKPFHWIAVRGNWGKSFVAPSLYDTAGAPDSRAVLSSSSQFVAPGSPASVSAAPEIILAGGNPKLKPQTASTWSMGFDAEPPAIPGLTVSSTFYSIDMKNQIGVVPFFTAQAFLQPAYAAYVIRNPSITLTKQRAAGLPITGNYSSIDALYAAGQPSYLIDARRANFGHLRQNGIDFDVSFDRDTRWGHWEAGVAGTYTLRRDLAAVAGAPFVNDLPGSSRFNLISRLGITIGSVSSDVTWSHTSGYKLGTPAGNQTSVGAFETVDVTLTMPLTHPQTGKTITLQVNVNNLFDRAPPFYNNDPGFANGLTLGRYVQIGLDKRF